MVRELFIWGVGEIGKRILNHLSDNWKITFVDSNQQSVGKCCQGKKVISTEEYLQKYADKFILIAHLHEISSIKVLQNNMIVNFFVHCNLPGEFKEPVIRENLKEFVINSLGNRKNYVLFGLGIYSIIIDEWIYTCFGVHPYILKQEDISQELVCKILQQYEGLQIVDNIQQINGIKEICVCLDNYSEIKESNEFSGYKVTDIFDCTDRITSYHNPKIGRFHNLHKGQRCFIVATGPSLRMDDLNLLKDYKEICISMNSIIYAFNKTEWHPDYYVMSDYRGFDEYKNILNTLPIKVKFLPDNTDTFWNEKHKENIYRYHQHYEYYYNKLPKFSENFAEKSYAGSTVTYTCLQLAVYMGFKEIYLLGVDFTDGRSTGGKYNHFYEEEEFVAVCHIDHVEAAYKSAKKYAGEHGIKIYNATRGGNLEVFERINFDDIFRRGFL